MTGVRRSGVDGLPSDRAVELLREAVATWRAYRGVPGVALVVANRAAELISVVDGVADRERAIDVTPDQRFQLGSIGKSFTAIALLRLAERGRVELDAPVRRYLPWFEAGPYTAELTLHHLLTHTAGIPMGVDYSDTSPFDVWALRESETMPPGRYWYSNTGYKTLGYVLEALEGRPSCEVVEREVLEPVGMAASRGRVTLADRDDDAVGYEPEPDRYPLSAAPRTVAPFLELTTGDGSVVATAADVARYAAMLLGRGAAPTGTLLRPESFKRLTARHARTDAGRWYGYGIATQLLDGRCLMGHSGDMLGFRASLTIDHAAGLGVSVLTNLRGAPTAELARHALRVAWADAAGTQPPELRPPGLDELRQAAGEYHGGRGQIVLAVEGDRARLKTSDATNELIPREVDRFEVVDPVAGRYLLRLERRGGNVSRITLGSTVYWPHAKAAEVPASRRGASLRIVGRYRSDNPWRRAFDVIDRLGRPVLVDADGSEAELVRVAPGRFREGRGLSPERVVFDAVVDGVPRRAVASGQPFYRA